LQLQEAVVITPWCDGLPRIGYRNIVQARHLPDVIRTAGLEWAARRDDGQGAIHSAFWGITRRPRTAARQSHRRSGHTLCSLGPRPESITPTAPDAVAPSDAVLVPIAATGSCAPAVLANNCVIADQEELAACASQAYARADAVGARAATTRAQAIPNMNNSVEASVDPAVCDICPIASRSTENATSNHLVFGASA
jgi:hypothetical protein